MMFRDTITTARLHLRAPRVEDAEAIFARYAQDPEVTRYLLWLPHERIEQTREFLSTVVQNRAQGRGEFAWVSTWRESDAPAIGMSGASPDGSKCRGAIGYVLARSEWGQGVMTEALGAVTGAVFERPSFHRVEALADVENPGSWRVMEKAGMQREGLLRHYVRRPATGEPGDNVIYAITRSEWLIRAQGEKGSS